MPLNNHCTENPIYEMKLRGIIPNFYIHVRGVLGNKCAGQHNLKTVQIRGIMWKQNLYGESFFAHESF
jgi:hypothetical protein